MDNSIAKEVQGILEVKGYESFMNKPGDNHNYAFSNITTIEQITSLREKPYEVNGIYINMIIKSFINNANLRGFIALKIKDDVIKFIDTNFMDNNAFVFDFYRTHFPNAKIDFTKSFFTTLFSDNADFSLIDKTYQVLVTRLNNFVTDESTTINFQSLVIPQNAFEKLNQYYLSCNSYYLVTQQQIDNYEVFGKLEDEIKEKITGINQSISKLNNIIHGRMQLFNFDSNVQGNVQITTIHTPTDNDSNGDVLPYNENNENMENKPNTCNFIKCFALHKFFEQTYLLEGVPSNYQDIIPELEVIKELDSTMFTNINTYFKDTLVDILSMPISENDVEILIAKLNLTIQRDKLKDSLNKFYIITNDVNDTVTFDSIVNKLESPSKLEVTILLKELGLKINKSNNVSYVIGLKY